MYPLLEHSALSCRREERQGGARGARGVWRDQALNLFAPSRVRSSAGLFKEVLSVTTGTSHSPGSMIFTPFLPPPDLMSLLSLLSWGQLPGAGVCTIVVPTLSPAPGIGSGMHIMLIE